MNIVDFKLLVILIVIAVTSEKGNIMILKANVSRMQLLTYIILHSLQLE